MGKKTHGRNEGNGVPTFEDVQVLATRILEDINEELDAIGYTMAIKDPLRVLKNAPSGSDQWSQAHDATMLYAKADAIRDLMAGCLDDPGESDATTTR